VNANQAGTVLNATFDLTGKARGLWSVVVTNSGGQSATLADAFTVMPKPGLATGMEIRNQASIIFDVDAPIDTPQWLNTIDNSLPASHVMPLDGAQSSIIFNVNWAGEDTGSGTQGYNVFVSENGGPFTLWQCNTTETSRIFIGQPVRA
jgi:hypothetical protein